MSKAGVIIVIGLCMAVLPFLGVPTSFKTIAVVVGGIVVMALGFLVREERRWLMRALSGEHQTDAYTENGMKGYAPTKSQGE